MREKVLKAFLEKNKVLNERTDLTKWKFDSYISLGKDFRKLPVIRNKENKMILLPTEYWGDLGIMFGVTPEGKITNPQRREVDKKVANDPKYEFFLAGSLNYPVYEEVLNEQQT